jgi:hypothetical protein
MPIKKEEFKTIAETAFSIAQQKGCYLNRKLGKAICYPRIPVLPNGKAGNIDYEINFYDGTGQHQGTQAIEFSLDFENMSAGNYGIPYHQLMLDYIQKNKLIGYSVIPFYPNTQNKPADWGKRILCANPIKGLTPPTIPLIIKSLSEIMIKTYNELHLKLEELEGLRIK